MARYHSKIFSVAWIFLRTILLSYAVIFSAAGTFAIVFGYFAVTKPIRDVKFLIDHNPEETLFMKTYRSALRSHHEPGRVQQRFVPLDSIAMTLRNSVIASEDDGFYTHPGIDIEAILKAAEYNHDMNKIVRGASTITQQLAKNLFLDNNRNFMRKAKELGYTMLLEKYLSKDRILELYLNYAQWGNDIFGCEAASQQYYRKSCSHLSMTEASRLAATLAMPNRISPLNAGSVFIQKRVEVIANNLYRRHIIDDSGYRSVSGLTPPKDMHADTFVYTIPR
jgi:monofunctional biosynthetic peptidoglycan transglycosylase